MIQTALKKIILFRMVDVGYFAMFDLIFPHNMGVILLGPLGIVIHMTWKVSKKDFDSPSFFVPDAPSK